MRLARIGDTISTIEVMEFGTSAGSKLSVCLDTAEVCREGNKIMIKGGWEVTKCGNCGDLSRCNCKRPETGAQS